MDIPPPSSGARQGPPDLAVVLVAIPGVLFVALAAAVLFESNVRDPLMAGAIIATPGAAFLATAIGLVRHSRWVLVAFLLALGATVLVLQMLVRSIGWGAWA